MGLLSRFKSFLKDPSGKKRRALEEEIARLEKERREREERERREREERERRDTWELEIWGKERVGKDKYPVHRVSDTITFTANRGADLTDYVERKYEDFKVNHPHAWEFDKHIRRVG